MRAAFLIYLISCLPVSGFSQTHPRTQKEKNNFYCEDATVMHLAAPTSGHINGYDFLSRTCTPAQVMVYYKQASNPENHLHIHIWDTDESSLSRTAVAPYAPRDTNGPPRSTYVVSPQVSPSSTMIRRMSAVCI